jgi:hypothetical protein
LSFDDTGIDTIGVCGDRIGVLFRSDDSLTDR